MIRRAPLVVVALAIIASCASQADQETQRIRLLARDAQGLLTVCTAAKAAKPQYAHLYVKFVIGFDDGKPRAPTTAQLTDREGISDDDVARGLDWYAETQDCGRESMDRLGKIDPELLIISARTEQESANLVRDIVQSHLTYGEANRRIMELRSRNVAAVGQWAQKLRGRLEEMRRQEQIEHQQFMAQIGAVTEALATVALVAITVLAQNQVLLARAQTSYAIAHPIYVPAFRITTTNCRWIGRQWSCTSY